jgi:hypothetical protein
VFLGFGIVILHAIVPDVLAAVAGPAVLACQLMILATALGAASASSRSHAQLSPYRRLYGDALRVPHTHVVFVRGQLLPLLRIAAAALVALMLCVAAGALPSLLPGTLLLSAAAVGVILKIVPVRPGPLRIGAGTVLVAVLGGIVLGMILTALPGFWNDRTPGLDWAISMSHTLRSTAEVAPWCGIVVLVGVGAAATLTSHRAGTHRRRGRAARTWPSAFLAMTTRAIGRGSLLLLRAAKSLAAAVGAFAIAAAIAPGVLTDEPAVELGIRAIPLVLATIVVASLSSFFGPLHVLPMLDLAARRAAGTIRTAITAYLSILALWIVPAPLTVAIVMAVLAGDVRIVIVGLITASGALAGLLLGSLWDRFALRLPDGTVELSLWGHTLTGLVPLAVTAPAIVGGTPGIVVAFLAATFTVAGSAFALSRRVRPL